MGHFVKRIALGRKHYVGVAFLAHSRRPSLGYDGTNITYNIFISALLRCAEDKYILFNTAFMMRSVTLREFGTVILPKPI
jgi:hypothetical protein